MEHPGERVGRRQERARLWDAHYVLAIFVNFCISGLMYLLITTTALYALDRFRTDELLAGVVSGSFVVGAIVSRLIAGKFLDVVGRRRILLLGLLLCVVLGAAQAFIAELWLLIVVRGLHGVAFGAASSGVSAGVLAAIPAQRRAEGVGYYALSTTFGSALGPLLGIVLMQTFDYAALFLGAAVWGALGLAAALVLRLPEHVLTDADRRRLRSWHPWTFLEPSVLPISAIMLVASIGFSGVLSFLNAYAVTEGAGAIGGAYFLFYAAVVFVSRLFVGRLQDRFGDNAIVYPLLVCLAAGLVVLWVGLDGALPFLSAALMGFGFGAMMPTVQTIVVSIAGPERVALATTTFFFAADIGFGVGPIIDGMLVEAFGYQGMYLALAGVALAGIVLYTLTHGRAARAVPPLPRP